MCVCVNLAQLIFPFHVCQNLIIALDVHVGVTDSDGKVSKKKRK